MDRFGTHLLGGYAAVAAGFCIGHVARAGLAALPIVWVVLVGLLAMSAVAAALGHPVLAGAAWSWGLFRLLASAPVAAPLALPIAGALVALVVVITERRRHTAHRTRVQRDLLA